MKNSSQTWHFVTFYPILCDKCYTAGVSCSLNVSTAGVSCSLNVSTAGVSCSMNVSTAGSDFYLRQGYQ
jgi:hypothetical protein